MHGHVVGDRVLCQVATVLARALRADDFLARYGGDEFVALLPGATGDGATGVAERLCYAVRKTAEQAGVTEQEAGARLTLSVGIACFPESGEHAASLVGAADRALAEARAGGGDGWRLSGGEVVLTDYQAQTRSS